MISRFRASLSLGHISILLCVGAALWFGACWLWFSQQPLLTRSYESFAPWVLLGSGSGTCFGLVAGLVGLLHGNPNRLEAILGVILNGAGLAIVSQFLLWGL